LNGLQTQLEFKAIVLFPHLLLPYLVNPPPTPLATHGIGTKLHAEKLLVIHTEYIQSSAGTSATEVYRSELMYTSCF